MKITSSCFSSLTFVFLSVTGAVQLAEQTGGYGVGTTQHIVDHRTPHDPTINNGTGTFILVTLYYPTPQKSHHPQPYFDPKNVGIWEEAFGYPNGSLAKLETNLQPNAPYLKDEQCLHLPTVVFNAGAGVNSFMYYGLLSELVSQGYTVVTLDHPGEPPSLHLPNGTDFEGLSITNPFEDPLGTEVYRIRLADTKVVVDDFPRFAARHSAPFNATHFISMGHSLGGALSANIASTDKRFLGGINLDGSFLGAPYPNVGKPFLVMTSINHTDASDPSLGEFQALQTAWWEELSVYGAEHLDYMDMSLWTAVLGLEGEVHNPAVIGAIGGKRMQQIVREYIPAFLDFVLGGTSELFRTPSLKWREVLYLKGSSI